jgi:hypothetical protein
MSACLSHPNGINGQIWHSSSPRKYWVFSHFPAQYEPTILKIEAKEKQPLNEEMPRTEK